MGVPRGSVMRISKDGRRGVPAVVAVMVCAALVARRGGVAVRVAAVGVGEFLGAVSVTVISVLAVRVGHLSC